VLRVSDVTMIVDNRDFLALLSAAHRGGRWKSGARSTAYLMNGIGVFEPKDFSRSKLLLSKYRWVQTPILWVD